MTSSRLARPLILFERAADRLGGDRRRVARQSNNGEAAGTAFSLGTGSQPPPSEPREHPTEAFSLGFGKRAGGFVDVVVEVQRGAHASSLAAFASDVKVL